jgi:hypothetical protein
LLAIELVARSVGSKGTEARPVEEQEEIAASIFKMGNKLVVEAAAASPSQVVISAPSLPPLTADTSSSNQSEVKSGAGTLLGFSTLSSRPASRHLLTNPGSFEDIHKKAKGS